MNFVVGIDALADGIQQHGAVGREPLSAGVLLPVYDADEEIVSGVTRNALGALRERLLGKGERCGDFRPDDNSWDAMRGFHADLLELVEVSGMDLQPVRRIIF